MQIFLRQPVFERRLINIPDHESPIVNGLRDLFKASRQNAEGRVMDATPVLPYICKEFNLSLSSQQDSHELYIQLVDLLKDADVIKKEDVEFGLIENYRCDNCSHRFTRKTGETCLHMVVSDDIGLSMDEYLAEEHLDSGYRCDGCGNPDSTFRRVFIDTVPSVLSLYIGRWADGRMNSTPMAFKRFRLSNTARTVYSPIGLVCYHGNGNGGHYLVYVKIDGNWYCLDDSSVRRVEWKNIYNSNIVYAFYNSE